MMTTIQVENLLLRAQQSQVEAQNQLGLLYSTGEYLSPDVDCAWYWFNEATKRGLEEARLNRHYVKFGFRHHNRLILLGPIGISHNV